MESQITINPHFSKNPDGSYYKAGSFDVSFEGKKAIGVTYDEMLGLISSITMPESRPCLNWLKTPEQIKAWDEKYNK